MRGVSKFFEIRLDVTRKVMDEYYELPSRTIARILHNRYPVWFPSVEMGRSLVRKFRGAYGEKNRRQFKDKTYVREKL